MKKKKSSSSHSKKSQKTLNHSVRSPLDLNIRIVLLSLQAIFNAIIVGFVAKGLMLLIHLITNIAFYGKFSFAHSAPSIKLLGIFVILIPVIGGIIVGLVARYGSAGIRGHGIPEAMGKVLSNKSKVSPIITILKPLASAIAIGTGGPFGAEGPAIATGGAFGSLMGQIMKVNATERKIILSAGASAGMAAIFGSPIAAIMLGIELLLFEFSPRSIIPVALSCAVAGIMHYWLFESTPIFAMTAMDAPSWTNAIIYSLIGIPIGFAAAYATKGVYLFEDLYKKLPFHWMWWPAIGGLAVGIIGYFAPKTMGVGYSNISFLLTGKASAMVLFSLCVLKYLSWSVSLASGTAGGTLAPLFTIGGGLGALIGIFILQLFPNVNISVAAAGLIGMAALFAGASGALLTSIIFVLETTGEIHYLLPVVGAATISYLIAYFIMKGSNIMTLEIERKGFTVPVNFEPDLLKMITTDEVMEKDFLTLPEGTSISYGREHLVRKEGERQALILVDTHEKYKGLIFEQDLENPDNPESTLLDSLVRPGMSHIYATSYTNLQSATETMLRFKLNFLPVIDENNKVIGKLNYKDILIAYNSRHLEQKRNMQVYSLKTRGFARLFKGRSK